MIAVTKLLITIHLTALRLVGPAARRTHDQTLERTLGGAQQTLRRRRDDRGSVTIEQVIWAVALIVIAGGVVTAITAYVNAKAGQIK